MAIGAEGLRLSNDALAAGLIEDSPFRIQPSAFLPFYHVSGDSLRYATATAIPAAVPITFNQDLTDQSTIPIDPSRIAQLGELATEFRVAYSTEDRMTNVNDQIEVQKAMAVRRLLYQFWTLFEQGDAALPGQFDGLKMLVDPAKEIDKFGATITVADLDSVLGLIRANDGYTSAIIVNRAMYDQMRGAFYSQSFLPQHSGRQASFPTGAKNRDLFCVDGVPVLVLDFIETDMSNLTSVWAVVCGPNALHGIVPESTCDTMFVFRRTVTADDTKIVGHMTWPVGLALGSLCALARLKNVSLGGKP